VNVNTTDATAGATALLLVCEVPFWNNTQRQKYRYPTICS